MPLATTVPTNEIMPVVTLDDVPLSRPVPNPVRVLIEALRSPLPPGFKWNFERGDRCAVQLAVRIGVLEQNDTFRWPVVFAKLGITLPEWANNPFAADEVRGLVPLYSCPARDVTPAMVAAALERLLPVEG
jgi:hypothetical protein